MTSFTTRQGSIRLLLVGALLVAPGIVRAQSAGDPAAPAAGQQPAPSPQQEQTPATPAEAEAQRFFDSVTVSATLNASLVKETPGTVSVIDAGLIERRLIENIADLVKFEPGVYVETVPTGVGLNGFNIRGMGGNRVMTQIDGVQTSEQFDFGPFNMHQQSLDLDTVKSAEIVRSAGSSLYGSDALGGVVSFFTKDPSDYLAGKPFHAAAKTVFDGRTRDTRGSFVAAGGNTRVQASLFVSYGYGHELSNKGTIEAQDATRTVPNPQDRQHTQALGKVVFNMSPGNVLRGTIEVADNDIDTLVYTSAGPVVLGPSVTDVTDVRAEDTLQRRRFSVDHTIDNRGGLTQWSWNAYVQQSDVGQTIDEVRSSTVLVNRHGTMTFDQTGYGAGIQGRKAYAPGGHGVLFTFGGAYRRDAFETLRDRIDINAATGATVPTTLVLPTKYFPTSDVIESGAYLQAEVRLGRVLLVPGVRYDYFSLDADQNDQIYLDSGNPTPADFSANAVSSKIGASLAVTDHVTLHGQYAGGFRAPAFSAVNNGFANLLAGYVALSNPNLRPETSDNFDFGVRAAGRRASVGVTGFVNLYDDFIDMATVGVNMATGLLEFQNQNITTVTIRGVELQGELGLTDTLELRASYAVIRGNDVSGDVDVPLASIAPDQGAVGLQYTPLSRRWGADLITRFSTGQSQERAGDGMFAPKAFGVVDVSGWVSLGEDVALRGGILNLTNATYFEWPNVRGRTDSPTIGRYSSPGISGVVSLSYGW